MFSTIISIYRDKTKNNGVRHIAIKSLELFISYAKSNKTFKTAENDFNNKFPSQKREPYWLHYIK